MNKKRRKYNRIQGKSWRSCCEKRKLLEGIQNCGSVKGKCTERKEKKKVETWTSEKKKKKKRVNLWKAVEGVSK